MKINSRFNSSAVWIALLPVAMLFLLSCTSTSAQFFAKTSKNLPRMGRRGDGDETLSESISPAMKVLLAFVRKYDDDANGCLSPEELSTIPIYKLALQYEDFTPLEIAYDVMKDYKSEVDSELKDVIARVLSTAYEKK